MALLLAGAGIACRCRRPKISTQIGRLNVLLGCFCWALRWYSALSKSGWMCCSFCRSMKICNLWMKSRLFGREAWNWMEWCEIHVKLAQISGKIISKNKFSWRPLFISIDFLFCTLHLYQDWNVAWCFWKTEDNGMIFAMFFNVCSPLYTYFYHVNVGNVGPQNFCREKGYGLRWRKWIDHVSYVWRLVSQTSKTQLAWCSTTPHRFLYLRLIHWYYLTLQGTCAIWAYQWPDSGNGWLFTWICP